MNERTSYCPHIEGPCRRENCDLFVRFPLTAPGPLIGSMKSGMIEGCTYVVGTHFLHMLLMMSMPRPAPGPGGQGGSRAG